METNAEDEKPQEIEPVAEWERPTVTEFDINSTTRSSHGLPGSFDGTTYS